MSTRCRQVYLPIWKIVARALALDDPKGKKKLVLATFNCQEVRARVSVQKKKV